MKLEDLKGKKIHLVGVSGAEVSSLAFFLSDLGVKNLVGHDFKSAAEFKESFFSYHEKLSAAEREKLFLKLKKGLAKINYRENYLAGAEAADIIFTASSWFRYPANKKLEAIIKRRAAEGRPVIFWNWYNLLLEFYPVEWVGVTGTAGKGTATNILFHLLKTAGKNAKLIGDSWQGMDFTGLFKAAAAAGKQGNKQVLIAEVNNRTLTFAKYSRLSPPIAVITNIFPNHLDDHNNSFAEYKNIKFEIGRYQKAGDRIFLNAEDKNLKNSPFKNRADFYSLKDAAAKLVKGSKYLFSDYLRGDALAAVKVAALLGVKEAKIKAGLKTFKPRSGRLEPVRELKGVKYVDDGAATRIKSAILAVQSFPKQKVLLILEGTRRNPDNYLAEFNKLIAALKESRVKEVFISGKIKDFLLPKLVKAKLPVKATEDLRASVLAAAKAAKKGEVVLLSPACESFGEFKDYRERSAKFKKIVKSLK